MYMYKYSDVSYTCMYILCPKKAINLMNIHSKITCVLQLVSLLHSRVIMSAIPINHEETQESSDEEPLLELSRGFRRTTKTKRRCPKYCSQFCLLNLIICVILNAAITIIAGAAYHFINDKAMEMAAQVIL